MNDYDKLFHFFVGLVGKERLAGRSPMNHSRNCLMPQPLIAGYVHFGSICVYGFSPHDLNSVHHVLVKIPR